MGNNASSITISHLNIRQSISLLVARLLSLEGITVVITGIVFGVAILNNWFIYTYIPVLLLLSILGLHLFQLVLVIHIIMKWLTNYYELYPTYLEIHSGTFEKKTARFYYKNIALFDLHQSVTGEMFNFGTLHLYDMNLMKDIYISSIHNPHRYYEILKDLLPDTNTETMGLKLSAFRDSDKHK